jgi:hypothetical protein
MNYSSLQALPFNLIEMLVLHDHEPWPVCECSVKVGMPLEDSLLDTVSALFCWPQTFDKKP